MADTQGKPEEVQPSEPEQGSPDLPGETPQQPAGPAETGAGGSETLPPSQPPPTADVGAAKKPAGTAETGAGDSEDPPKGWWKKALRLVPVLAVPVVVVGFGAWTLIFPPEVLQVFSQKTSIQPVSSDEVANAQQTEYKVVSSGRVLYEWKPVVGSNVWVTAIDALGNTHVVETAITGKKGEFEMSGEIVIRSGEKDVPIVAKDVPEVRIQARGGKQGDLPLDELVGRTSIRQSGQVQRSVGVSVLPLVGLPMVFFLSLWVAFIQAKTPKWRRNKHMAALLLAFLFTTGMIYAIGAGWSYVEAYGQKDEILSLGYGFLYRASYVKDSNPEWVFSFTSPGPKSKSSAAQPAENSTSPEGSPPPGGQNPALGSGDSGEPSNGFGAPLWVMLLSVIGAAISTVSLLIVSTKKEPNYEHDGSSEFRASIDRRTPVLSSCLLRWGRFLSTRCWWRPMAPANRLP